LTKATYDAVGNKFRALWGKEAGWAHSVLFTADLRTFSDRLVAKIEVKDETVLVKKEADLGVGTPDALGSTILEDKRVKRDVVEHEHQGFEIRDIVTRQSKRRKKHSAV